MGKIEVILRYSKVRNLRDDTVNVLQLQADDIINLFVKDFFWIWESSIQRGLRIRVANFLGIKLQCRHKVRCYIVLSSAVLIEFRIILDNLISSSLKLMDEWTGIARFG